jgi:hypothetical protein
MVESRVTEEFGVEIGGDLSLLHAPIAEAVRVYFAASQDIGRDEAEFLMKLLGLEEEGTCEDAPVLQPGSLNTLFTRALPGIYAVCAYRSQA